MKNQIIKGGLLAITLMLVNAVVHAACPQSSLAGTWEVFISEAESVTNIEAWRSCSLILDRAGTIVAGSYCVSHATETSLPETDVTGSILSTPSLCSVTGVINIGGDIDTIYDGQINKSKSDIYGVGTYAFGHFSFRAVKR